MQRLDPVSATPKVAGFALHDAESPKRLALHGHWVARAVGGVDGALSQFAGTHEGDLDIDLSEIESFDTAGAWLVQRLRETVERKGFACRVVNATPPVETLLAAIAAASEDAQLQVPPAKGRFDPAAPLVLLGRIMFALLRDLKMAMHILGATIRGAQMKLGHGPFLSFAPIINQIDRMGVGAIPVVLLMSTIIGAIIAQQGAFQLRYFGAEIFVVDLVAILVLREIGVLLTAIMIAGRSGSAITAEVGSMKMREEVDALTVIGLNPIGVLVFPRLVALVIALPLLTIVSNFAALGGAMFVAQVYSDITPDAFIQRMREAIDLTTIFAGLIKAPFMAMIIGIIASVEGLKVEGSAESLGRRVTASVVKAIFVVIVVDGLFAMFYAAVDF